MDRLFHRYADPFSFINGMIRTGRLVEFVENLVATENQEKEDKANWEFFLHKVFEGSFHDFVEQQKIDKENQNMSERQIETTMQNTHNILNQFNPEKGGE